MRDKEAVQGGQSRRGRGPLLFSKHLVNDSNPIKHREKLWPRLITCINMYVKCACEIYMYI